MNKKIKVLEVIYGFGYGGIRAFIMNYLTHINKEEFEVDIYAFGTASSPFTEQVEKLGAHIYFEPSNISNRHIPDFVKRLTSFIKEHGGYDVVHANCNMLSAWVLLAAKRAGVAVRLSHSHSTSHFSGSLVQKIYSGIRRIMIDRLATTKLACGTLAGEKMYGRNSDFIVIANGIEPERFMRRNPEREAELRKTFGIPEGVRVYANVTRMDPQKNHIFAVNIFNEIHKIDPTAIFLYGGTTPTIQPMVEPVKRLIKELGIEDFTRYTGPIMDIENLYHITDVWLYCSSFEGLPFGPIELQAASIPCLASDIITKEIDLGLGLISFLSLSQSAKEWADIAVKIYRTTKDPDVIKTAFIECGFDIKCGVANLESIYRGELQ